MSQDYVCNSSGNVLYSVLQTVQYFLANVTSFMVVHNLKFGSFLVVSLSVSALIKIALLKFGAFLVVSLECSNSGENPDKSFGVHGLAH